MRLLMVLTTIFLLNACALPLDATIIEPTVRADSTLVHDAADKPIQALVVAFRISGKLVEQPDNAVMAYKYGKDRNRSVLGGSLLRREEDGYYRFHFLVRQIGSFNYDDYDLANSPFDVCLYLQAPAYPFHRESNRTRIQAAEISLAISDK